MISVNDAGMKRAALLNDLSCFGKCSLTAAIPILSAWGVETVPMPTALLSAQTVFPGYILREMTEEMRQTARHWRQLGVKFDCVYTGFFAGPEQIALTCTLLDELAGQDALILVDPVLGDNGQLYSCFERQQVEQMRQLCYRAHIITPNHTEAALLAGMEADAPAEVLLDSLSRQLGVENMVITGVRRGHEIGYVARLGQRDVYIWHPRAPRTMHGTGDVFASALCGALLSGAQPEAALERAADFCQACVEKTLARGEGHWYAQAFEDVLRERCGL